MGQWVVARESAGVIGAFAVASRLVSAILTRAVAAVLACRPGSPWAGALSGSARAIRLGIVAAELCCAGVVLSWLVLELLSGAVVETRDQTRREGALPL
jgi:hypothetical protein